MLKVYITISVITLFIIGIFILPVINRHQLKNMPFEQQIRILIKQANKLVYWKNISSGTKGVLVYIKNKRKILGLPWILIDGKMLCTKENPLDRWDYPEEHIQLNEDEINQFISELEKYNKNKPVKFYLQDE